MCVCMYVCMYIYTHMYVCMYVCMLNRIYVYNIYMYLSLSLLSSGSLPTRQVQMFDVAIPLGLSTFIRLHG